MTVMTINDLIDKINDLPPTPQIFQKLQALLKDEEIMLLDILPMIKMDAPLTAQIIKISNSSYFALPEPCTSLEDAVNRIGFKEVYQMVCILTFNKVLSKDLQVYDHASGELWEYSLITAIILEGLAHVLEEDIHTAYTIGLIHALGKVIINTFFTENVGFARSAGISGIPNEQQAHEILGFDYADVAAALFKKWDFDEIIITPIRYQQKPEEAPDQKNMTVLLSQAKIEAPNFHKARIGPAISNAATAIGLTPELYKEGMRLADARFNDVKNLLRSI